MRTDASVTFVPLGGSLSLVGGAGVSIPSNVFDGLGQGVGTAPANIIGTAPVFGADYGIGSGRPLLDIVVGIGLATSNGCTLNVAFQGAPDTGAAGNYQPGTWVTFMESGPKTAAQCPAGTRIARFDWAAAFPENTTPPRYIRLLFQVPSGENFTAGTISFALATLGRDDQANKYAARSYSVV